MNNQSFIDKEVVNKHGQRGTVIAFDEQRIVVKYPGEEKSYNPDVAFKNKFLSFVDESLNCSIDEDIQAKEKRRQELSDLDKAILQQYKRIHEERARLESKNRTMRRLFGDDFVYPPYVEFVKKYGCYTIPKKPVFPLMQSFLRKVFGQ